MKRSLYIVLGLLVLGATYYFFTHFIAEKTDQERMRLAYESYLRGERATTLAERSDAFNQALREYIALEDEHQPRFGNGKLYYNIGNTYFQLGQYPFAILYYYKALALMPRSDKVVNNLKVVQEKLGIIEKKEPSLFGPLYRWMDLVSLPERIQLFFGLAFLAFVLASVFIWTGEVWLYCRLPESSILDSARQSPIEAKRSERGGPFPMVKGDEEDRLGKVAASQKSKFQAGGSIRQGAICFAILAGFILVGLIFSHYFEPVEGVLVKSTPLYRDAGFQYARVQEEPLLSGVKVEVLDLVEGGGEAEERGANGVGIWVKITTPEGTLGYVPQETLRVVGF